MEDPSLSAGNAEVWAINNINEINRYLSQLSSYNTADFQVVSNASAVEESLLTYAQNLLEKQPEPGEEIVTGSIVHDWISNDGAIRFYTHSDGTYLYKNDNNHVVWESTYTWDGKTLIAENLNGKKATGYLEVFDGNEELTLTFDDGGFMTFQREAGIYGNDPEAEPVPQHIPLTGKWTRKDGSMNIFFDTDEYKLTKSDGSSYIQPYFYDGSVVSLIGYEGSGCAYASFIVGFDTMTDGLYVDDDDAFINPFIPDSPSYLP
jgi:hypothetical protein